MTKKCIEENTKLIIDIIKANAEETRRKGKRRKGKV